MSGIRSGRREALLYGAGSAAVALHTAVDTLVAPERGTRWDDHLVPAAASLLVVSVCAAAYQFLRAGLRAALALALGALALVGAGIGIADARGAGPRGDDWTGLLLAPAGLALCLLGARLLWRSRKPGGRPLLRRAGLGAAGLIGAYVVLVPLAVAIVATHRPRAAVEPAELGRRYEPVTLRTRDGLDLAAWYLPSRNGAAVVSYPTRQGALPQARLLARHGYGVLLLDMRGYDGSDGAPNAFGWGAKPDIDAAVAWLQRRADVREGRVGGIGFSVGGELLLEAAATNPGLRAVVSEGAGERSVRESVIRGPRGWLAVPTAAVQTAALALLSGTAPPPSLEQLVAQVAPRPILLIQAGRGAGGEELNADYFRAAAAPKTLWRIEEAGHVGGLQARPAEYERRVTGFFDRALLRAGA
jgi:uncharacterized protein